MSRLKGRLWPVTTVAIILGMLALPAFSQDEPPTDNIADLMKKAEQGDASSQFSLAFSYHLGLGVSPDHEEALRWYRAAAEQGYMPAQETLGDMYYNGNGVPQDYQEAVRWYRAAAEQGDADAQNNLGVMYNKGQGVPQDYIQAHMWCNLAASHGGDEERETAVTNRDVIAEKMTAEQVVEAQRLAREWKPKTGGQ